MKHHSRFRSAETGMTLYEVLVIILGTGVITALALPALNTSLSQYNLVSAAQGITSQLQYARLKAVSSNETFRVSFPSGTSTYQVETGDGSLLRGPFYLPSRVTLNTTDAGTAVTFPGKYITFQTNGSVPTSGNGSTGRVKLINQSGVRIDVVVASGGVIRQTPPYRQPPAPF